VVLLQMRYLTEGELSEGDLAAQLDRGMEVLVETEDHDGLARAWRLQWLASMMACQYGAGEHAALELIQHARAAGDEIMESRAQPSLAVCYEYGPTPVPEAIARCQEILEAAGSDRKAEAHTLRVLSHLEAMQGDFDRARDLYRRSRANLEELGWRHLAAMTALVSGAVEMLAPDFGAAERELRHSYEVLDEIGERNYISTIAGDLAEALYGQDRLEEAEAMSTRCRELAAEDDVASQVRWRCVLGKVRARTADPAEGARLLNEARELIARTDDLNSQGDVLLDLATVLRAMGREEDASRAAIEARSLYERKGNVVSAGRAIRESTALRGEGDTG
jgi:ATP/maltotriose-dependent transcriptional regulator MalT